MASKKDEIVLSYENTLLRKTDFKLLDQKNWLNDNIISFWFSYLHNHLIPTDSNCLLMFPEMSQFFKSAQKSNDMFNELKQILNDISYSNKNILFLPINDCDFDDFGGNHWSLLVFYKEKMGSPKFEHYDSLENSSNIDSAKIVAFVLSAIYCNKQTLEPIEMPCTKQTNSYDCGIHVLCNVEALIGQLCLGKKESLKELANLNVINNKRQEIIDTILRLKSQQD